MNNIKSNDIIFGKDQIERIVSIEPKNDLCELFIQEPDGKITSKFVSNKYWILSDVPHSNLWVRLKGNSHYKYGLTFTDLDEWKSTKSFLKYKKQADIFSIYNQKEQFLIKNGVTYFKGLKHNEISILCFDIETDSLFKTKDSRIFLISNVFRKPDGTIIKKLFSYDDYSDNGEMLVAWCEWVRECNPSILSGFNIVNYDLQYMQHVADLNEVSLDLGRDGSSLSFESYESKLRKDQTQDIKFFKPIIYGREVIDSYFLAIKHDQIFKSWSSLGLKTIIKEEGLEQPGRTFYDAALIRKNYSIPEEWEKIKTYCEDDALDALNLYDKLIPSHFYFNRSIPKSFQGLIESASGGQINSLMLRNYLQNGESVPKGDSAIQFPGAISLGYPGIYNNVNKLDIQSLYPNIMLQYNINNLNKDPYNYLLQCLEYFTNERIKNKKLAQETGDKQYEYIEQSAKVFINSAYGFMGATNLNFNDLSMAAKVTEIGRGILNTAIKWAKEKNFVLTSIDTDSIAFCKPDQSWISEEEREELRQDLNKLYPERIRFMPDGYFSKSIVFGAKNYILWNGKKLKTKGSALKSSTLEKGFQQFLQDVVRSILEEKDNYLDIYNTYIKRIWNIQSKEEMKLFCSKKTLSNTTFESERLNERKIVDAVQGTEYVVGDKVWLYYTEDESLKLIEHFDGKYDRMTLIRKLWNCTERFSEVLTIEFPKYHLKRQKEALEAIINGI